MTPKQLLQCNVRLWDSDRTVSCPKNYPDSFIAYYDNYKINLEIYYSMTTGPDPDNSLGMYPQARMIFTDDGDAIRKMSKRRFKVLQRLSGL